jgi:hypothetical protein
MLIFDSGFSNVYLSHLQGGKEGFSNIQKGTKYMVVDLGGMFMSVYNILNNIKIQKEKEN